MFGMSSRVMTELEWIFSVMSVLFDCTFLKSITRDVCQSFGDTFLLPSLSLPLLLLVEAGVSEGVIVPVEVTEVSVDVAVVYCRLSLELGRFVKKLFISDQHFFSQCHSAVNVLVHPIGSQGEPLHELNLLGLLVVWDAGHEQDGVNFDGLKSLGDTLLVPLYNIGDDIVGPAIGRSSVREHVSGDELALLEGYTQGSLRVGATTGDELLHVGECQVDVGLCCIDRARGRPQGNPVTEGLNVEELIGLEHVLDRRGELLLDDVETCVGLARHLLGHGAGHVNDEIHHPLLHAAEEAVPGHQIGHHLHGFLPVEGHVEHGGDGLLVLQRNVEEKVLDRIQHDESVTGEGEALQHVTDVLSCHSHEPRLHLVDGHHLLIRVREGAHHLHNLAAREGQVGVAGRLEPGC